MTLTKVCGWVVNLTPTTRRKLWKVWYDILAGRYRQPSWKFMNFGYAEIDPSAPEVPLHENEQPNRFFIQLYHHVVSSVQHRLGHADVLEVGCGRGGGSAYIARYFQPRSVVGVDFSGKAIALCQKEYSEPNLSFQRGEAEALPCADESFDFVVNVESSHCYGDMDAFMREVRRVLRPGGCFLWTDMCTSDTLDEVRQQLTGSGLTLVEDRLITDNVLRALDVMHDDKMAMIRSLVPKPFRKGVQDFSGTTGSRLYEDLRSRRLEYASCVLSKSEA